MSAIKDELNRLLSEKERYKKIGENSRKRAIERNAKREAELAEYEAANPPLLDVKTLVRSDSRTSMRKVSNNKI